MPFYSYSKYLGPYELVVGCPEFNIQDSPYLLKEFEVSVGLQNTSYPFERPLISSTDSQTWCESFAVIPSNEPQREIGAALLSAVKV